MEKASHGPYDHLTPSEERTALYAAVKAFLHAEEEYVEIATRLCLLVRKRRVVLHAGSPPSGPQTTSRPSVSFSPQTSQADSKSLVTFGAQTTPGPQTISSPTALLRHQALTQLAPHTTVRELWRSILVRVDGECSGLRPVPALLLPVLLKQRCWISSAELTTLAPRICQGCMRRRRSYSTSTSKP